MVAHRYAAAGDEPSFPLLGRDPMAGILIRVWAKLREDAGEDPATIEEALFIAASCERYAISLGKEAKVRAAVESLKSLAAPP